MGDPKRASYRLHKFYGSWEQGETVWNERTLVTPGVGEMVMEGAGSASTPGPYVAGDIDVRVYCSLIDWSPGAQNVLVSDFGTTGNQRSWQFFVNTAGTLGFQVSQTGTSHVAAAASTVTVASVGIADGQAVWLRATVDIDNGAAQRVTNFYWSNDGQSWTPLGATVTQATALTNLFNSTAPVTVGSLGPGTANPATGTFHYAEVRSGIDGTVVASPDFRTQSEGQVNFTDGQGNLWSVNSPAAIEWATEPVYAIEWHQNQTPYLGGATFTTHEPDTNTTTVTGPDEGLLTADRVYYGGHVHEITEDEAADLVDGGYGDRIDIADREIFGETTDAARFTTKLTLTSESNYASGDPVIENGHVVHRMTVGPQGSTNLRELILLDGTTGWTDVQVDLTEIAPPAFGINYAGSGFNVLPQAGVCLRAGTNGVQNYGVTLNNNIAFGLGMLNVGVWRSNVDGTGFVHREQGWPFGDAYDFPYGFTARLVGTVVTVSIFRAGMSPLTDDPTKTHVIDLETDAGDSVAIPTPTEGQCGIVSAHLGMHPMAAIRLGPMTFRRIT